MPSPDDSAQKSGCWRYFSFSLSLFFLPPRDSVQTNNFQIVLTFTSSQSQVERCHICISAITRHRRRRTYSENRSVSVVFSSLALPPSPFPPRCLFRPRHKMCGLMFVNGKKKKINFNLSSNFFNWTYIWIWLGKLSFLSLKLVFVSCCCCCCCFESHLFVVSLRHSGVSAPCVVLYLDMFFRETNGDGFNPETRLRSEELTDSRSSRLRARLYIWTEDIWTKKCSFEKIAARRPSIRNVIFNLRGGWDASRRSRVFTKTSLPSYVGGETVSVTSLMSFY